MKRGIHRLGVFIRLFRGLGWVQEELGYVNMDCMYMNSLSVRMYRYTWPG
jgi:hypothetical protein